MPFACELQPRRVSCLLVDSSKMQKILAKAARNKHTKSELFLVSLHFSVESESIKTDFGPNNLKSLSLNMLMSLKNHKGYLQIEEFSTITFVLPLILSVNDVIVFLSLNMRNLKDNVPICLNRDWSECLIVRMLHLLSWLGNLMILFGYVSITKH